MFGKSSTLEFKKGLDDLLTKKGYRHSDINGKYIYFKGAYSPEDVSFIKDYLENSKGLSSQIAIAEGGYDHFIGDYWVDEASGNSAKADDS